MLRLLLVTFFVSTAGFAEEAYRVEISGVENPVLEAQLRETSKLIEMQERPPGTRSALRHRAQNDIPQMVKVLHSFAYFNAHIELDIDREEKETLITFVIDLGAQYPFASFEIAPQEGDCFDYCSITLDKLGIVLGRPAYPETIIHAEEKLIKLIEQAGHPMGRIVNRSVVADQADKVIHVILTVDSGPLTYFGPLSICGNEKVLDPFFSKKLRWSEGEIYDPCKVNRTLEALEASSLFSSIEIIYIDKINEEGAVPIEIHVSESKMRSIGAGLSFTTQRGSGVTAEWEHRNLFGLGEKFRANANIWQDTQEASVQYVKPDYLIQDQDLIYAAELQHADTKGYRERSFTLSTILDRQLNDCTRFSYGVSYKQLRDTKSDNDGEYSLLKIPSHFHWFNTGSLLDPRNGESLYFSLIPTLQMRDNTFGYLMGTASGAIYRPFDADEKIVIAIKGTYGAIIGTSRREIPPSERFYAGTQDAMRGYRYLTVSPLNGAQDKPIGGRSMLLFSTELRIQSSENLGWVAFSDFGQVYKDPFPNFKETFLQSLGVGIRYFTPVGPLRFDVAFPLDRRKKLDDNYQFYISVGQAF